MSGAIRTVTPPGQVLEQSTLLAGSTANVTLTGADVAVSRGFARDAASGRLASVTAPDLRADYYCVANRDLVGEVYLADTPHDVSMTTTRHYDRLNRVTNLVSDPRSFSYPYNSANQRTRVADDTGANALNQYTNRTVPGYADILGSAATNATVTVNDQRATRQGEYYRVELPATNTTGPATLWVTNLAVLRTGTNGDVAVTNTGQLYVPQTPQTFLYDADGNLTNDGRWAYTRDDENQLQTMESLPGTPSNWPARLEFAYDPQGRRVSEEVSNWVAGHWSLLTAHYFVCDGWNLLAEVDATTGPSIVLRDYVWGLDLSETPQGGSGVGGVLLVSDASTLNSQPSTHFVTLNGNGNVRPGEVDDGSKLTRESRRSRCPGSIRWEPALLGPQRTGNVRFAARNSPRGAL